jgi:hypothetical protein
MMLALLMRVTTTVAAAVSLLQLHLPSAQPFLCKMTSQMLRVMGDSCAGMKMQWVKT